MKPKNILGIHGFLRTPAVIDFFEGTKKNLTKRGVVVDHPVFEKGPDIKYKNNVKLLKIFGWMNINKFLLN